MSNPSHSNEQHRAILQRIAHRVMLERGLLPDFSPEALTELERLESSTEVNGEDIRDLRSLLWCSIDNDDSRDLDQLTVAQTLPGSQVTILVAIADVETLVKPGSAIDEHAQHNTTSVYTAAQIFPMLPEKLSTDLTSLNFDEDRLAFVVDMTIGSEGALRASTVYRALVHNYAKLAYNSLAAWLEGAAPLPEALAAVGGLADNLRLQDKTAQAMHRFRQSHGALSLETIQSRPVFDGDMVSTLEEEEKNRAKEIIEDFMIAANGVTARFLSEQGYPTLRRVVRTPKRWDRIVAIAKEKGFRLSDDPDPKSLETFLVKQKAANPQNYPDLCLTVIKLLGSGEYAAQPGGEVPKSHAAGGHFGLAVKDYGHSTAPNRRYPDLVTQRLLSAALQHQPTSYQLEDLEALAQRCTEAEDAANKVERQVGKSAAALLLESRIGEQFDALVTGAAPKGTWVRLLKLPVEGKLVEGFHGVDVGDHLRVQLVETDVEQGYIDFKKI
jgi:VacB/RNase II family 3'-5' exoribonuclease